MHHDGGKNKTIILGRMLGRTQGYALSANAMRNQDTNPSLVFFYWQSVADSALVNKIFRTWVV